MSRSLSPRVLITFAWVLLLPIGAFVLCQNGFVGEAWRDEQYKKQMSSVSKMVKPTPRLLEILNKFKENTITDAEKAECPKLLLEASANYQAVADKLLAIKPQEKDRASHEELVKKYQSKAAQYKIAAEDWEKEIGK